MRLRCSPLAHRPLSVMVALALCMSVPAAAHASPVEDCDGATEDPACTSSAADSPGGRTGWLIGGLAVLAGGAAAAGGGGSGGSGAGNDGGAVPSGREGGQFNDRQVLVGAGAQASWTGNLDTRIAGTVRNEGALELAAGSLRVLGNGHLHNHGTLLVGPQGRLVLESDADLDNHGRIELGGQLLLQRDAGLDNLGSLLARNASIQLDGDAEIENLGSMALHGTLVTLRGESEFDNGQRRRDAQLDVDGGGFVLSGMAEFDNHGSVTARGDLHLGALVNAVTAPAGTTRDAIEAFNNHGSIQMLADARVLALSADSHASTGINRIGGQIFSQARGQSVLHGEGSQATLLNQGTITVTGDNAVAMSGTRGATLINDGTINLGIAGAVNGQHMVAMQSDGSATLNNRRGGVINIHADNSHAFRMGTAGGGRLINNGQVNIYASGSAINADAPTADANQPAPDLGWQAPRGISGYTVGTNADGSAGRMVLHQGGHLSDVAVDTGFTRGTAASQVRLEGVFVGADGGEQNIRSASVVWRAQAERDGHGQVDVVMTRNDYRELAEAPLQGVAAALEAGYASNALFHSLEVADAAEFNRALQQLSGSEVSASSLQLAANGDAFWSSLARTAPMAGHTLLAFGPGTETTLGVRGTGTGMQVAIPMRGGRQLQLISGLLGSDFSGDGGQTRSHSRFAGLGMAQTLGAFSLQHSIGNEWHQQEGQRQLNWATTRLESHSRRSLSRTRVGSTLSRDLHAGGVRWQPRIAASAYHSREAGFHEYGAHALGLSVGAGTRSGVQLELGSTMQARLGARWSLQGDAALIGALASHASDRLTYLHGAPDQAFTLPGTRASGLDYRVMLGANYRRASLDVSTRLLAQRQFGATDTQAQLHMGYRF